MDANGAALVPGDEVKVSGFRRARWTYRAFCESDQGVWLEVFGGLPMREALRSFPVDRVTKVTKRQNA